MGFGSRRKHFCITFAPARGGAPWITPRLEIVSMGYSIVINASADIMPYVRKLLEGKTRDEVFWMPFVYGINPYFLPDLGKIAPLINPNGFEYELVEKQNIPMWQIGVDVLLPYRGKGLASALVSMLTLEILSRGYIPYYFTSDSHVVSMHTAVRAGYIPAWVDCYKTRLDGFLSDRTL